MENSYGYSGLSPKEEQLRQAFEQRGMQADKNMSQTGFASPREAKDLSTVFKDRPEVQTTEFAQTTPQDTGMSNSQMGSALGGAAGVAKASGSGGAVSGALSGAAVGSAAGPWGAVIGAAVGLVGGIMGDKAGREQERRQRIIESLRVEMHGKQLALGQLQQGTQAGIGQILAGTSRALS